MCLKRKFAFFAAILIFTSSVSAQERVKLWTGKHTARQQKWSEMTAFLPEMPDTSGVCVVICPGGSYYWLDMNNEGFAVAKYLNTKGIVAFVLHYRTARSGAYFPAAIQDLQRAMQIVRENAEKYKINPEKIGVMGFSAGGHLAGTAAEYWNKNISGFQELNNSPLKPRFAAMIYPVVTMSNEETVHKKSRRNLLGNNFSQELADRMSLEKNVHPDMPPVFLLHCTGDKTVDYRNSVEMDKALTANKIPHKFLLLEEDGHWGHGFGIQPNGKATGWIEVFLEWMREI